MTGCGRFFEGTPEEMNTALNQTLAALPEDTKVYVSGLAWTWIVNSADREARPRVHEVECKVCCLGFTQWCYQETPSVRREQQRNARKIHHCGWEGSSLSLERSMRHADKTNRSTMCSWCWMWVAITPYYWKTLLWQVLECRNPKGDRENWSYRRYGQAERDEEQFQVSKYATI